MSKPTASQHIVCHAVGWLMANLHLGWADLRLDRGADGNVIPHLVLCCSDGYFYQFLRNWISRHFKKADILAVPGSGLELCLDANLAAQMVKRIEALRGQHRTTDIWVVFHNGCAGYAFRRNITNPTEERSHQLQDMACIEDILRELKLTGEGGPRLHFAIARTHGFRFVPLSELMAQAQRLGLTIQALERDLAENIRQLPR